MSDVVIRAEGLGKRYLIGHQSAEHEGYTALRDVVGRSLKDLGRSALDMMRGRQIIVGDEVEEFWALKDVSFEIKRGEVVGIIGRNGAGKSTLLKILSRITEPSTGRVEIKGRVASLLEVGTGFHPELTGRENIYLNGAILGMGHAEIKKKFDGIVAFAEVEKFLDTPVKRYSSGMYVRLAFAVAAHLEPNILIIDEVLAVGDAAFQKKCLGKMSAVAQDGRTVAFVSHNMAAIRALCTNAIYMKNGQLITAGPMEDTMAAYDGEFERSGRSGQYSSGRAGQAIHIENTQVLPEMPVSKCDFEVHFTLRSEGRTTIKEAALLLYANGMRVAIADLRLCGIMPKILFDDTAIFGFKVKGASLVEGEYSIGLYIASDTFVGHVYDLKKLVIRARGAKGIVGYQAASRGIVDLDFEGWVS